MTTPLPPHGWDPDRVAAALAQLGEGDVRWREGRAFSLVYSAGPEVAAVADDASRRYGAANALNVEAFPSLAAMQRDVVAAVAGWVGAPPDAAGYLTSGGTESILMAVLGARERHRAERGITSPNVVLATSAHAAFSKACHYFGLEERRVAVRGDWRADPEAMAAACDDATVLVVASAPSYPQGVVDDVPAIAALAGRLGANCHVDACMGGVTLPHLARLGHQVSPWGLEVPGVSSVSVDLHKYGYTAKGASVIVWRDRALRRWQTYATDDWLGGRYGSSGVMGTKSGGPIAAAWAVMHHLGDDGYLRLAREARAATQRLCEAVGDMHGGRMLRVMAPPDATLVAIEAVPGSGVDPWAVAEELWRRGWWVDRQGPPPSIHLTVNAIHGAVMDDFVAELRSAVEAVAGRSGSAGSYGTVG